jgi:hypothetical protein
MRGPRPAHPTIPSSGAERSHPGADPEPWGRGHPAPAADAGRPGGEPPEDRPSKVSRAARGRASRATAKQRLEDIVAVGLGARHRRGHR